MTRKRSPKSDGSVFWSEGKQRYIAQVFIDGRYRQKRAKTHKEAMKKKKEMIEIRDKKLSPENRTLEQQIESWLDNKEPYHTYNTQDYHRWLAEQINSRLSKKKITDIRPADIQELINEKHKNGYSFSTVRGIYITIRAALQQAVDQDEILIKNPAQKVQLPPKSKPNIEVFDEEEFDCFIDTCLKDEYGYIFIFALATGLRAGELLGLEWENVNLEEGYAYICKQLQYRKGEELRLNPYTKGKDDRYIGLGDWEIEKLQELRGQQGPYTHWDLVFRYKNGRPIRPDNFRQRFKRILKRAGLDPNKYRLHDLRHYYSTKAIEKGMDFKVVSENLGHSTPAQLIDTYSHATRDSQKKLTAITSRQVTESLNRIQANKQEEAEVKSSGWPPDDDELKKIIWEMPTTQIAEKYGVSDKTVEKRCKSRGIEKPPRGYWAKVKSEEQFSVTQKCSLEPQKSE